MPGKIGPPPLAPWQPWHLALESWLHVRAPPAWRGPSLILLVAVVAAIRLAALPLRGTEDVLTWKIWMIAASKNVTTVYGVGGQPPVRGELHWLHHTTTVDYPPVALYELGAAGVVYRLFDPEFADRPALTAAVKIPGLFFGIALTVLLWWTVLRLTGDDRPATWVAARVLGEPSHHPERRGARLPGPADDAAGDRSLVLLHRGAPEWAGASLAVAMLTKPQALLVAADSDARSVANLWSTWRHRRRRRRRRDGRA